jgi:signal transduction histidine kinase
LGLGKLSGTGRRLLTAFVALIVYFTLASSLTLVSFTRVRAAFARAGENAERLREALELSSAVRDQYAHQAHTIILGNAAHVPLYRAAHERVLDILGNVEAHAGSAAERAAIARIAAESRALDTIFFTRVLTAVERNDKDAVAVSHNEVLARVTAIERATAALAAQYEEAIQQDRIYAAQVEQTAFTTSLGFLLFAPFLAALVGLYVGRAVTRPVNVLHAGAARIAAGDLTTPIEIASRDEFGALAAQFNAMTAALRRHQAALVESERLAGVGRLAAGVAHEINNPLGVILGYVRLLAKKADAATAADLAVIEEETLRCKAIVEGLLDLSRTPKLERSVVELGELARHAVERLVETSGTRAQIAVHGAARVEADSVKLGQVVFNLVKNALEAAGEGGRIGVDIAPAAGGVTRLTVSDNGPGVAAEVVARLFEPFVTTKKDGMGLGLSVCKSIAQAHGGELTLETGPQGSRFTLSLPSTEGGRA